MSRNGPAPSEFDGEFTNEVIRASAGTGKTFELSNRYLRLLASGVDCSSILATTFTRKGAGEILDRIMQRLSAAALDESAAAELSDQLRWKLTSNRAADILHKLLQSLHRLEVGTLDGFFNRFAKAFSLELGLPATWEIVENQVIQGLQDRAIERILHEDHVVDLFHLMSHGEAKRRIATELRDIVKNLYEIFTEATAEAWEQIPRAKGRLDEAAFSDARGRIA
jgi:ATP-dependent exoDNAse (exonuclease V) beta subunit